MTGKLIVVLAAFYHVMATVAAMMAIFHFARALRGEENSHPFWRHVFNWGETHLWISGAILIGAGIYLSSLAEYLNNPKLWTKVSLVVLWAAASYAIRRSSRSASATRRNLLFGISSGSLLYGTFLGSPSRWLMAFCLSLVPGRIRGNHCPLHPWRQPDIATVGASLRAGRAWCWW
ncbi:hypothetical protein ACFSQE_16375 [Vogesella fluminis]|uniref:hypothetical protein n=1 Tax=Vogesella fluminis TaxID=1069161 RepID=UPI00363C9B7E